MACTKIYRPAFEIYQNVRPEEKSSRKGAKVRKDAKESIKQKSRAFLCAFAYLCAFA